ncbi:GFA family protein [Litoribrevibacter albus]|uniref:Glutathione-dependent formaldehyde-activating enzyme GfaB n=1 Tax=Litoribrevibacter albus TaxID=1473156 RepID=A0AA37S733_9GAMM|nr:GFA family protein [Litoribrevibacter albus]GLQ30322.1 glutathione-dependent formaldehyde-activating enzyme GfaB [Litoribrevibacter albus]
MEIKGVVQGSCHCGSVVFDVDLPKGFEELTRCNCSMCARRGAVVTSVPLSSFTLVKGQDHLTLYQFNTKTAEHYFCDTCGIYTHHKRRSNPNQYAVNVACLDGVNPFELGPIPTTDGQNHSCDRK